MTGQNSHKSESACGRIGCGHTTERRPRGRQRRFCSDACRQQAFRSRNLRYEMPVRVRGHLGDLNASAAVYSKTTNFVTSKINDLALPSYRGSVRGIVGPKKVILAEVVDGREWQEVVSADGVKWHVSRLSKRALVATEKEILK
jgi:hypothetical protein